MLLLFDDNGDGVEVIVVVVVVVLKGVKVTIWCLSSISLSYIVDFINKQSFTNIYTIVSADIDQGRDSGNKGKCIQTRT